MDSIYYEYLNPISIFEIISKLAEEVGEIAEGAYAFNGSRSKKTKLLKKGQTPKESLIEEIGDVIIVCLHILKYTDIKVGDLVNGIEKKLEARVKKINAKERVARDG